MIHIKADGLSSGLDNNNFSGRTKDLNPNFRNTRAAPYRALTLSQADSKFNLTKVRAFKASVLTWVFSYGPRGWERSFYFAFILAIVKHLARSDLVCGAGRSTGGAKPRFRASKDIQKWPKFYYEIFWLVNYCYNVFFAAPPVHETNGGHHIWWQYDPGFVITLFT